MGCHWIYQVKIDRSRVIVPKRTVLKNGKYLPKLTCGTLVTAFEASGDQFTFVLAELYQLGHPGGSSECSRIEALRSLPDY